MLDATTNHSEANSPENTEKFNFLQLKNELQIMERRGSTAWEYDKKLQNVLGLQTPNPWSTIDKISEEDLFSTLNMFAAKTLVDEKTSSWVVRILIKKNNTHKNLYDWVFSSQALNLNTIAFDLKEQKHFYFSLFDKLLQEYKKSHSNMTLDNGRGQEAAYKAILSFLEHQKIDPNVMHQGLRPLEYFLSSIERSAQTTYAQIIKNYAANCPEILTIKNELGRTLGSYIYQEHILKELKPYYALAPKRSWIEHLRAWFFGPAYHQVKKQEAQEQFNQQTPSNKNNSVLSPGSTNTQVLTPTQEFALLYLGIERLILQVSHQSRATNEAQISQLQTLSQRYLSLFNIYEKQMSGNQGYSELEHFLFKQFPQIFSGSLVAYTQAVEKLQGADLASAQQLFADNLSLIAQHLSKQEAEHITQTDSQALFQMKVENKYLSSTVGAGS